MGNPIQSSRCARFGREKKLLFLCARVLLRAACTNGGLAARLQHKDKVPPCHYDRRPPRACGYGWVWRWAAHQHSTTLEGKGTSKSFFKTRQERFAYVCVSGPGTCAFGIPGERTQRIPMESIISNGEMVRLDFLHWFLMGIFYIARWCGGMLDKGNP